MNGGIFSYRARFSKTGKLRFLSHHDLARAIERLLRRSGLPLRMTEGFNPHPIIAFPTALGVGIESTDEVFEFELSSWVAPRAIERALAEQCPEGLAISGVETFDRKKRSFVDFVEYEATCPGQTANLPIEAFLAKTEHRIDRVSDKGTRSIDLRPYVMALDVEGDVVYLRIKITDSGTAKPDEVLRALGIEIRGDVRIRKTYTELRTRDA